MRYSITYLEDTQLTSQDIINNIFTILLSYVNSNKSDENNLNLNNCKIL